MVSPVINFCCDVIKSLELLSFPKSSTRTVAVAFDVPPVMVSPASNLPSLPAPFSKTILLPSTSSAKDSDSRFKRRLSILTVRRSSPASRY